MRCLLCHSQKQLQGDTAATQGFRLFVIRGPRGVGKSRLVSESFQPDKVQSKFKVFSGNAVSSSQSHSTTAMRNGGGTGGGVFCTQ